MNERQKQESVADLESRIANLRSHADRFYAEARMLEQQWITDNAPIQPGDTISWDYGAKWSNNGIQKRRTGVVDHLCKGVSWSLRNHDYDYVIKQKSGNGLKRIIAYSWHNVRLEKKGNRKA